MKHIFFDCLRKPVLRKSCRSIAALLLVSALILMPGCGSSNMTTVPDDHKVKDTASDDGGKDNRETAEETDTDTETSPAGKAADKKAVSSDNSLFAADRGMQLINTYFDETRYWDNGGGIYFQCFGNHILCTFETEKAYPRLSSVLQKIADNEEKVFRDEIRDYEKDAEEYSKDMKSSGINAYYSHFAEDVLKRADDRCVSIVRVVNGFLGGAHPDYYYETYNISARTGERIRLSDVISDQKRLNELLEKKLTEEYPDVEFFDLREYLNEYDMTLIEGTDKDGEYSYAYDFTLDPDGIEFYFSPYGISAYAYGSQVVKILYEEEPSLFKEDYAVKGGYISYLTDLDNKYDIGGTVKSVGIEKSDYDESGYFTSFEVFRDGDRADSGEIYAFGMKSFIAHTDDGNDYVYIITNMDSDYRELFVSDLNGDKLTCSSAKEYSYTYRSYMDENSGQYGDVLPSDPADLELAARCDLLSTYNAYGMFEVGADGMPVLKGDYLTVPERFTLTSAADFKTDIVGEGGNVTEKDVTIPKGQKYTLYRTDGREIVDAKLSDGRIVRFKVSSGFPHMLNDTVNEEELFEELYYAG